MMISRALAGFVVIAACATGGHSSSPDDAAGGASDGAAIFDARSNDAKLAADAAATADAMIPIDAPPQAVDAPPPIDASQELFCDDNSDCPAADECCIRLGGPQGFCGPGTEFAGECIPN